MVTLNPAKLLHIDHKVGSIEVGKDADVVLWSGHPLSVYSKAEKTLIEGATYFDIEKDKEIQALIQQERLELTKLMLKVKASGAEVVTPIQNKKERFTCDTL
jgi:adenine deaminase